VSRKTGQDVLRSGLPWFLQRKQKLCNGVNELVHTVLKRSDHFNWYVSAFEIKDQHFRIVTTRRKLHLAHQVNSFLVSVGAACVLKPEGKGSGVQISKLAIKYGGRSITDCRPILKFERPTPIQQNWATPRRERSGALQTRGHRGSRRRSPFTCDVVVLHLPQSIAETLSGQEQRGQDSLIKES